MTMSKSPSFQDFFESLRADHDQEPVKTVNRQDQLRVLKEVLDNSLAPEPKVGDLVRCRPHAPYKYPEKGQLAVVTRVFNVPLIESDGRSITGEIHVVFACQEKQHAYTSGVHAVPYTVNLAHYEVDTTASFSEILS